jgi:hypothetical protein
MRDRPYRLPPRGRTDTLDLSDKLIMEGIVEVGPKEDYFAFVDGEYLGALLRRHFGVGPERGYTSLGRLRITVERLEEPGPSDGTSDLVA